MPTDAQSVLEVARIAEFSLVDGGGLGSFSVSQQPQLACSLRLAVLVDVGQYSVQSANYRAWDAGKLSTGSVHTPRGMWLSYRIVGAGGACQLCLFYFCRARSRAVSTGQPIALACTAMGVVSFWAVGDPASDAPLVLRRAAL
jgi:hypothetical protein